MYFWYKFITYLLYPFAPIYLYFRKLRKKEDFYRYKEKLSIIKQRREDEFLIWIHMASVGEAMSVLPLIENFIQNKKIGKILLTSITLSSSKIIEKKFKNEKKIVHQFSPLDIPFIVKKFLNHWKPNLSIFIDSEIWPNLIIETNNQKIPLLLVNARITNKTFVKWKLFTKFAKKIFEKFSLCIVSNNESEDFLKILGAKNIKNYGNLKFSSLQNEKNLQLDGDFLNIIKNKKIWCAASTHSGEEKFCAYVHASIKKSYENILTIIIPRHIERIEKIKKDLFNLNLKIALFSKFKDVDDETDILLVDSYGEALKFYNISKCVFLGKSLVDKLAKDSGQNPIEPARLGCKIYHGPNVSNFDEIYKYLNDLGVTQEVKDPKELGLLMVEEMKNNDDKNLNISEKLKNHGQTIFNNVIMELKKYI